MSTSTDASVTTPPSVSKDAKEIGPATPADAQAKPKPESPSSDSTPAFKWALKMVKDLGLAKSKPAKKMCSHFQVILRAFIAALQDTEARERIQKTIPPCIIQTATDVFPRVVAAFQQNMEADAKKSSGSAVVGSSTTRPKKVKRKKKKKNPSKVMHKAIKKLISTLKSIKKTEWEAFVTQLCSETTFKTPENVLVECTRAMQQGGVTMSDVRTKLRSKMVGFMRGKNSSSSISTILSQFAGAAGVPMGAGTSSGIHSLMTIAQSMMSSSGSSSDGKTSESRSRSSASKREPQGLMAMMMRGFVNSQRNTDSA